MPSLVGEGEGYLKAATINDLLIRGVDLTAYKNELNLHSHISGDYPELEGDRFGILSQVNVLLLLKFWNVKFYPSKFLNR